ncbi:MAG: PAS domain S-box protein, partial [Rhodocyclaceae bacterium]
MRTNLPVTQNEVLLKEDTLIVSKTDLKGRITYINKDFLDISGFTEAELLGEPHNLVRHPDMPEEAFADLWTSLKEDRPWVGLVKNRCKNGDYYWVEAHAAPVFEGEAVVGYMSVRRQPSRDAVDAAAIAYQRFKDKKANGLAIRDGRVISTTPIAKMRHKFNGLSISAKVILCSVVSAVAIMALAAWFLGQNMAHTLNAQGQAGLAQSLKQIEAMVEVQARGMERDALRLNDLFAAEFQEGFSLEPGETPVLKHGKTALNGRNNEVDHFSAASHAVATAFARRNDDFVRIATSVKNEKGERAVGTLLDKASPAYAKLLAGERYTGRVKLFNKDFYAAYTPLKDSGGKVIGALFTGVDVSAEIEALKKQIRSIKIGDTGYFYVLDARAGNDRGTLLIHPAKEGSNIIAAKDSSGREFIKEMLDRRQGTIRYPWANAELGDSTPREKVVVFDTFGEWQWLIGGGTYVDEFEGPARASERLFWAASSVVAVVLVAIIYVLFNALVRRPLADHVLPAFRALSAGRYNNAVDTTRSDEVGRVMQGLETMQNRLGFEVAESKRQADEMTRIKIALDNATVPVRIADEHGKVIYANRRMLETLGRIEPELKSRNSSFSVASFVGSSIGNVVANPTEYLTKLAALASTVVTEMEIGGRIFKVTTTPVADAAGNKLGSVGEWIDRTDEIHAEKEVAALVAAAAAGDFSQRLSVGSKEGFFLQLAEGLNRLSEVTASGLQ